MSLNFCCFPEAESDIVLYFIGERQIVTFGLDKNKMCNAHGAYYISLLLKNYLSEDRYFIALKI